MTGVPQGAVDVVNASAGTGKTHRLCETVKLAIAGRYAEPEAILAVTFTRDAARELLERTRSALFQAAMPDRAQRLLGARIGTVHGVFGGLLAEHALAAGRSPGAQVVEDGAKGALFRIAADAAIARHAASLNALARRFGHEASRRDWRKMVGEVVDLARQNGIAAARLAACADRSWATLQATLEPAAGDGAALDAALARAVRQALRVLPGGDPTLDTGKAVEALREAAEALADGELPWPLWAKLSKLKTGAQSRAAAQPVLDAAAAHARHPRLRADLEAFIRAIFACAAEAMDAWQGWKAVRGLVDFADQEAEALAMLDRPEIAARIADDASLLLVDEFQDTSPMQLALFLKLAALLPRSVWVGDPKQAIYGFRGTDPELMGAVAAALPALTGGKPDTLRDNFRSRPGLVGFCNALFGQAFLPGMAPDQVTVAPRRGDHAGAGAALQLWRLAAGNNDEEAGALAAGVAAMLEDRAAWPVGPWDKREPGPLRGGDIAVLCRTNESARRVAEALAAQGLRVALGRSGLLARAECVLALAGLRWLADASDTVALAEMAHVLGGDAEAPAWLATALGAEDAASALAAHVPGLDALRALRDRLDALTPAEALDAVIAALDLPVRLRRWGDAAARLANLEALRGLARSYEDGCRQSGLPATAPGLCAGLAEEEAEEPASPDPDAVRVLTVHKAKGLEWPVVILADLDMAPRGRLFDQPVAMPRDGALDARSPLEGRWIRLWPWPYGAQKTGVGLDARAEASAIGASDAEAAAREALRLLYVAMTRARDWLVLAPRLARTKAGASLKTAWLDVLGAHALDLPATGQGPVAVRGVAHDCMVSDFAAAEPGADAPEALVGPVLPAGPDPTHTPKRIRPSSLPATSLPDITPETIGPRLPLKGQPDMAALGEAVHGFLAADHPDLPAAERLARAERLLHAWQVSALPPRDVVAAGDALWRWIGARWPGCTWRSEVPVLHRVGDRILSGRVDLVVRHADGLAVIDHKTFPGGPQHWPARAAAHQPQLEAYARAIGTALEAKVTELFLHLPVTGSAILLSSKGGAAGRLGEDGREGEPPRTLLGHTS